MKKSEQREVGSAGRDSTALKWDSALRMETWHQKPFECCVHTSSGSRAFLSPHYNFIALFICLSHPFAFTIIHRSAFFAALLLPCIIVTANNGEGLGTRLANNSALISPGVLQHYNRHA